MKYAVLMEVNDKPIQQNTFDDLDKAQAFFTKRVHELGGADNDVEIRSVSYWSFSRQNYELRLDII